MPHIPDSRHTDHDPLAVAAYAAGGATGPELELARDLVVSCADCASLQADLRAISAALPELPVPARPRDFTLTPEQAASLRPSGWRRLLAPLAGPRFAFAGPLGGGLATLGIAGLLVAGSLGAPVAGSAPQDATANQPITMEAPASPDASTAIGAAPVPEIQPLASGGPAIGEDAPNASGGAPAQVEDPYAPGDTSGGGGEGSGPNATDPSVGVTAGVPDEAGTAQLPNEDAARVAAIGAVGVLLLAAGLVLGGLRLVARRSV